MSEILDELNMYVPMQQGSELIDIDGRSVYVDRALVSQRLLFGDQVTVARIRGAKVLRSTHFTAAQSLQGFVPVVADWHARLCLVTVCTLHSDYCTDYIIFAGDLGTVVFHLFL